jgi:hypothetical protein
VTGVRISEERTDESVDNPATYPGSHQTWPRRAR